MGFDGPDYYARMWPVRTGMGENQARYLITAAGAIAGNGGTGTLDITVPTNYNMTFQIVTGFSPVSLIQEFDISIDSVIYWREFYDVQGRVVFPVESCPVLTEGQKLTVTIVNNDSATQTIRLCVAGLYEEA